MQKQFCNFFNAVISRSQTVHVVISWSLDIQSVATRKKECHDVPLSIITLDYASI